MLDMHLQKAASIAAAAATLVVSVFGHMEMISPCPRYSPKCATQPELPPGMARDYNLNSPIGGNGNINQPFCKYPIPWPQVTETWTAGQPVTISFANNGASHSGGHCEFSVSFDGGKTFVVLFQELRKCFFTAPPSNGGWDSVRSYTFTLPPNLPGSSHAVFAWSWVNAIGNREFYMNCADVAIVGNAGSYAGKAMTIANYGPAYPTIPEFMGNYETGVHLYAANTTQVTVTGSGYSNTPTSITETFVTSSSAPGYTVASNQAIRSWI
ncbi:hypothetical protein GGF42_002157 [Coemansia sp. RSA 2424]|nr:hypothetical protein GGF42_002157 [Coemansia sp. RSA 2424]